MFSEISAAIGNDYNYVHIWGGEVFLQSGSLKTVKSSDLLKREVLRGSAELLCHIKFLQMLPTVIKY